MRDIIAVPFRQKRLLLISFAVLFVLVILWGAMRSGYKAEMKILVRRERMDPVVTSQSNVPTQVVQPEISEAELNSEVELVKSPDLLEKVVIANNLQSTESSLRAFLFGQLTPETQTAKGVRNLSQRLKVEPLTKSDLISVSFESSDPQLAAHVLRSLASLYLEKHFQVHRPSGEFGFFDRETERLRQDLSSAENRLTDFTREQGVVSAQLERDLTLQKTSDLEASLTQTQAAIAETEQRIHALQGGKVRVEAKIVEGFPRLAVCDTGRGVPSEERKRIFRRFYRGEGAESVSGHGLGLSIAQAIANLHGFQLDVEDNRPGARFIMRANVKSPLGLARAKE